MPIATKIQEHKACLECGTVFIPTDASHVWQKFCSVVCRGKYNNRRYNDGKYERTKRAGLCTGCHVRKPQHGLLCLQCRDRHNARGTQRWKEVRVEVLNHYGGVCACCGEGHYEFLSIDHVNGGGRQHRKAIGKSTVYEWLIKNSYPLGFRVLCHNCNQSIGLYGDCPHSRKEAIDARKV